MIDDLDELLRQDRDWLSDLKPYQRELVEPLLRSHQSVDAIEIWFESFRGASNTAPFGAGAKFTPYYERFLDQLHDFFCSEKNYAEERASLLREVKAGQTTVATSIAVSIAPYLGTSAPVLAPAIAMFLTVFGKAGLNAICAEQRARGRGTGGQGGTDVNQSEK